ncbi:MAG: hypothetical protein WBB48_05465 [Thermodesulfobacteriota bacterium]
MDLLISMQAEILNKGIYFESCTVMQMPTARTEEVFVAEFREGDTVKLKLLKRYVEILENKLTKDHGFKIENTNYGFKLLRPVDQNKDYMEDWEEWVVFTRQILIELKHVVGEEIQEET